MQFPAYSIASPYLPFSPQPAVFTASPIVLPMHVASPIQNVLAPVAVQTPMVSTTTFVQPPPYVPSPVIPVAVHPPRSPSPRYYRTPPQRDDGRAADMPPVLVQPQQAVATPAHLTINITTPQQHPMSLRDHPRDMPNANYTVMAATPIVVPAAMTSRTVQVPSNGGYSVNIQCSPLPGIPQPEDQSWWSSKR
jgi:hypothetical protein